MADPIEVEVGDTILEFPAGMSQEQIKRAIDEKYLGRPTGFAPPPEGSDLPDLSGQAQPAAPVAETPQLDVFTGSGRNRRRVQTEKDGPDITDKLIASYEVAKALIPGGIAGAFGFAGANIHELLEQAYLGAEGLITRDYKGKFGTVEGGREAEQRVMERTQAFTRPFMPESELGMQWVQDIGETLGRLPVIPQLAFEAPIIAQAARAGLQVQAGKLSQLNERMAQAAQLVREQAQARAEAVLAMQAGEAKSIGAAELSQARLRQEAARQLPVGIDLTEGQATRTFEQQRFERETAKLPEPGKALRERFADQNQQLIQNFDAFIDEAGAELYYPMEVGEAVEKSIRAQAAKDMGRIRRLYNDARAAGEMGQKVDHTPLSAYLNENRAERAENSIMTKVQRQLEVIEVASGDFAEGTLELRPMTLNQSEAVRRFINRNINNADSNDIRIGATLKDLIDASTQGEGGAKYRAARKARRQYAEKYENVGLISNILGTKRGSSDRIVALEDVARKSILSPSTSLASTKHLRRLLQNSGDDGQQAWRELQGYTLRHLQDQMTRNVARNERGDPIVSPAMLDREIKALDRSGKLDFMFGKKGAETLRTVNDVAKVVLTSPPGAVNTSNTATVLAGLMDIAISGSAGVPAPLLTTYKLLADSLKDRRLKAQVDKALNYIAE